MFVTYNPPSNTFDVVVVSLIDKFDNNCVVGLLSERI